MLLPIQPGRSGERALVVVHGQYGFVPYRRGRDLIGPLGRDRPIYGLESRGFDGTDLPPNTVAETARDYLAEIAAAGVTAPVVLMAVCEGYVFALEMARQLAIADRRPPLILLIDPPGAPPGGVPEERLTPDVARHYRDHARAWLVEASARVGELPFDLADTKALERATEVAMRTVLAICRHVTPPYAGRVDILATGDRALQINRPDWPWRKELLSGPWTLAKLDCLHQDLFSSRAGTVFEWMKARLQTIDAPQNERAGAQS